MVAIFVGGNLNGLECDVNELELLTEWSGRYSMNWSAERNMGAIVPRAELDNRPIINGYLSPMWDGDKLRYETREVYDVLSH